MKIQNQFDRVKFPKNIQKKQDEIFKKMSAEKKLRLTSDFSEFLLRLHKLNKDHEF